MPGWNGLRFMIDGDRMVKEPTSIAKAHEDLIGFVAMQEGCNNSSTSKLVCTGTRQEEGIDYDELDVKECLSLWRKLRRSVKQLAIGGTFISHDRYVKDMLTKVRRLFKYLKGQPNSDMLWFPKDSLFQLEAYSDYAWKQTIVATSFNRRRAMLAVLDAVHRTKHIEIRHHFIRDANEKNLIQVLKIHTDDNVADLLTKAFDGPRFEYLVVHIGMVDMVLVSAGSTMILLGVILPAGCFVSAGSYGLCCWFRVHAGRHTSPGGFISADRVFVYAVNTSFYAAELVCAGSIMFLLAELFLLVVTCLCCLNLVSAVLSLILLVGWSLPLVTQFLLVVSIPAGVSMYLLNE
ncbi:hypothetical protein Tco_0123091 [Tanacetum coccineum]